jgi:hypothetical protein
MSGLVKQKPGPEAPDLLVKLLQANVIVGALFF